MDKLKHLWIASREREQGQGLVEYALIIALVAILLVVALMVLQSQLAGVFSNISGSL